jgi:hypothetical protein
MLRRMQSLWVWATAIGVSGWVLALGPARAQMRPSAYFPPGDGSSVPGSTVPAAPSLSPGRSYSELQFIGPASTYFGTNNFTPTYFWTTDTGPRTLHPGPLGGSGPSLGPQFGYPAQGWNPTWNNATIISSGMPYSHSTMPTNWSGTGPCCCFQAPTTVSSYALAAPSAPFKVADGTGPIRIWYGTTHTSGRITLTGGQLAEKKDLSIQLVGQVTGPDWINVAVSADVPGLPVPQPLGTFLHKPGLGGVYKLEVNDMETVAKNLVALMNHLDYFSIAHQIPTMTVSLRIIDDNPKGNARPIDLAHALTIEPDLVVMPAFTPR